MDYFNNQIDIQFVKTRANFIRHSFIEEMEKHLLAFEKEIVSNNINVKWIVDEEELCSSIISVLPKSHYNKVCFDLPSIPFNLANSSNIVKEVSVSDFENNIDSADHLVVAADFGIVETGNLVLINKKSKNCFNKVQDLIIILDINKLIVRQHDLDIILSLKNLNNSLHFYPEDIKLISAPIKKIIKDTFLFTANSDFTTENVKITLLLYDNGITKILENNFLREALYCIECGKCKTICPIYNITHRYSPIDLVRNYCFQENIKSQEIFNSTTLCGNCNEVCPVQIPFTDLLISEMEMANSKSSREKNKDLYKIFMKRGKMNKMNGRFKRFFFIKKYYGKNKKLTAYFNLQNDDFFNIIKMSQKDINE